MDTGHALNLNTTVQYVRGVGPARAKALETVSINTVEDLLYYFPRRHLDRTTISPIKALQRDTVATAVGTVQVCGERRARHRKFYQAVISDGTGLLNLVWFNGGKYINQVLKKGVRVAVNGKVEFYQGHQIVHPEFDILNEEDDPLNTGAVIPLYPLNQAMKQVKIENRGFRRIIHSVLKQLMLIPDLFPDNFLKQQGLIIRDEALRSIHFAADEKILTKAVHRLKFDEHFFLQLLMALKKACLQTAGAPAISATGIRFQKVYEQLEFELTDAQKRVLKEIRSDLGQPVAMNRLLQGDVGSGKTIVAMLTAAIAVGNGYQVAVMAPTE
nr:ATP-dependent DNA helicase RecG [Candidatus Neomarinimicrobiota bacterium]